MIIQTHKTTEASLHLPTGPLNFYFHLSKSKIYMPRAIGPGLFPALSPLGLVIVGSIVPGIWQGVIFLSFWGGWGGLRGSLVLFG